ncbi:hypothetical protein BUY41_07135 [Staphylococcus cohnii]|uniref:hypothetical protein n=1 Tax=Staphylococcaceae TaxID=90964 RepID=UPI0007D9D559|nr:MULTISPECIES: hypothetical protein [Staphylococcaceae]AQM42130.1 hypothetical protein BZ166_12375 [Staphylococcus cohnii]OAO19298.1 hypothetical protein AXY36_11870 [Staphylococcus cohnii]PTE80110.1 hypothetical protein BUY38_04125 [Staphylococcus cohnii]PTF07800.1 hypothetical protein BUY41_07135 [Staphylococcus cohnii]PTF28101.1 hypothetical protein BUY19_02975 [Staphylococcus cohnii]
MRETKAFFIYYSKIVSKDKITLFWSILFPLALGLLSYLPQQESFNTINEKSAYLYIFWAFTTVIIFINGIGSQTSVIRQQGLLRTFFSISGKKFPFLLSIIFSQILVAFFAIVISTITLGSIMGIISLTLLLNMIIYLALIIPLAPAFLIIAYIPVRAESLMTIVNILTIALFFIASNTSNNFGGLEWVNPIYYFKELSLYISNIVTNTSLFIYLIYLLYLAIGIFCLFKLDINSKTQRT